MIYVIRHGQTKLNEKRQFQGRNDSPLTLHGKKQALDIAAYLLPLGLTGIFSSDSGRALATARPTAQNTGLSIRTDIRLRELHFGALEGLTYEQAMDAYGPAVTSWYNNLKTGRPPGGESMEELHTRVMSFMQEHLRTEPQRIAIFTHGGVCNLLHSLATGNSFGTAHWSAPGDIYVYDTHIIESRFCFTYRDVVKTGGELK